jgi:Protein of unknown function (DUF2948)
VVRGDHGPMTDTMTDLKLIALDAEDLGVVSAHLQDAVLKVEEMAYLPREKRFAAVLNRFDWASAVTSSTRRPLAVRRRSALRIERVTGAQLSSIDLTARTRVLSLLAVQFEPAQSPAGAMTLVFAGGAAIRLDVECIEAELRDLGPAWAARGRPDHGGGVDETPVGRGKGQG